MNFIFLSPQFPRHYWNFCDRKTARYAVAGVATARLHKVTTQAATRAFVSEVGYPLIAKPAVGVGATDTLKLSNAADLEKFFADS